jgi:hypothetical protein
VRSPAARGTDRHARAERAILRVPDLRLIGQGHVKRRHDHIVRQRLALRPDLQDGRADGELAVGKQPDRAQLDFAALAQHLGFKGQRRHRNGAHQVDGDARDPHRHRRRNALGSPHRERCGR